MSYLNNNKYGGRVVVNPKSSKTDLLADAEYYQSQINDPDFTE